MLRIVLGKLPVTIFQQDYVNLVPLTDMNMRASNNNPGRSYRYYKGPVSVESFRYVALFLLILLTCTFQLWFVPKMCKGSTVGVWFRSQLYDLQHHMARKTSGQSLPDQ